MSIWKKLWRFLNQPFVATIIGGIIILLITMGVMVMSAHFELIHLIITLISIGIVLLVYGFYLTRKFEKEQEKQIKELEEERKKFLWGDLNELQTLLKIFKNYTNTKLNRYPIKLANEMYQMFQKGFWYNWIEGYKNWWEELEHYEEKVESLIEKKETLEKIEFLSLVKEFNSNIREFINAMESLYGERKDIMKLPSSTKEGYNKFCGLCNAFCDRYTIFQNYIARKYDIGIESFGRSKKIEN